MPGTARRAAIAFVYALTVGCSDASECSIKTGFGGVKHDENCEWLEAGACPESRYDDQPCTGDPPAFAFGVHFLQTVQCGSRTCAEYAPSFGEVPCPPETFATACFGPTEEIPCAYTLCPEPPTCAWEVYNVGRAGLGDLPGCPGLGWKMYEHGAQPPVPTCDGNPPITAYGVEYTETEYDAQGYPCGRYGKSKPCDYLACLDFDSCDWLLSEVKANHVGDRTKCAGWGHEGEPILP